MMFRSCRIVLFAFALVIGGCSAASNADGGPRGSTTRSPYRAAPAMSIDAAKSYVATLATSKGTIVLALDAKAAPATVNNFVFLARDRFYDGLTFHRVEPDFVIQGGDPDGDGSGGPGYTIPDETNALAHVDGALAMAKSAAPNSAGSQFYITLGAQPSLDGKYTVFGKATSGLDVVKSIAVGDTITSISISEK